MNKTITTQQTPEMQDTAALAKEHPHAQPAAQAYLCGELHVERDDDDDSRPRALLEIECPPEDDDRIERGDIDKLDLFGIAFDAFSFNANRRAYGSRFARNQAEASRATASIAALLATSSLHAGGRTVPIAEGPVNPGSFALDGAKFVSIASLLPMMMRMFDRRGVDATTHRATLLEVESRFVPECSDTLAKHGFDTLVEPLKKAVSSTRFAEKTANAPSVSSEVYRAITHQCAECLQVLFAIVQAKPHGDSGQWVIEGTSFPQAPQQPVPNAPAVPAVEPAPAAEPTPVAAAAQAAPAEPAKRATRPGTAPGGAKKK
jgi:hypothetical protein